MSGSATNHFSMSTLSNLIFYRPTEWPVGSMRALFIPPMRLGSMPCELLSVVASKWRVIPFLGCQVEMWRGCPSPITPHHMFSGCSIQSGCIVSIGTLICQFPPYLWLMNVIQVKNYIISKKWNWPAFNNSIDVNMKQAAKKYLTSQKVWETIILEANYHTHVLPS